VPSGPNPIQLGAGLAAHVREQAWLRADDASKAMLDAIHTVLSGPRGGKSSKRGGVVYVHSAPGEAPAEISGALLGSWVQFVNEVPEEGGGGFKLQFGVESIGVPYVAQFDPALSGYTPPGNRKLPPRPFVARTMDIALPAIRELFNKPWLLR